jgi:hypothetical protein
MRAGGWGARSKNPHGLQRRAARHVNCVKLRMITDGRQFIGELTSPDHLVKRRWLTATLGRSELKVLAQWIKEALCHACVPYKSLGQRAPSNWSIATFPDPGVGAVRIRVEVCGVCHSDSFTQEGTWPGIQYPRVPGHEIAGVIDSASSSSARRLILSKCQPAYLSQGAGRSSAGPPAPLSSRRIRSRSVCSPGCGR